MIRIFLTASAEVVRTVGTSDSELGHMFGSLTCHRLSCLILRRVIWCRWIEGEYLVALRTLDNITLDNVTKYDVRPSDSFLR